MWVPFADGLQPTTLHTVHACLLACPSTPHPCECVPAMRHMTDNTCLHRPNTPSTRLFLHHNTMIHLLKPQQQCLGLLYSLKRTGLTQIGVRSQAVCNKWQAQPVWGTDDVACIVAGRLASGSWHGLQAAPVNTEHGPWQRRWARGIHAWLGHM